jgi:purine-binding chemotaxis protein CheW
VANWRGRLLPVLDLRPVLGADATDLGTSARLVVLSVDGVSAGLVVDAVEGTRTMAAVEEFPAALADRGSALLAGQVPTDAGPVAVLDSRAVLRLREELPRAGRGG